MTFTATQHRINERLAQLLVDADCQYGTLRVRPTPDEILAELWGVHSSGVDVWLPVAKPLKLLLGQYDEETPHRIGFLTVRVDLSRSAFTYRHVSVAAQAQADEQAQAADEQAQADRDRERRKYLEQHLSTAPYGSELAAQVAEALAQGCWFNYDHPAYCGMGFDVVDGHYRYGDVWEGILQPSLTFADRPDFVAWLAQQSDRSLARLESGDSSSWHNQTITRDRLLKLVGEPDE